MSLLENLLLQRKDVIVASWLKSACEGYAENSRTFFLEEKDCFRNPVGNRLRQGLPALFDALVSGRVGETSLKELDPIIRMRAVQDFSPSQAVSFIFMLKPIARQEVEGGAVSGFRPDDWFEFDRRVDRLALQAFDLFAACREKLLAIKAGEYRRWSVSREPRERRNALGEPVRGARNGD